MMDTEKIEEVGKEIGNWIISVLQGENDEFFELVYDDSIRSLEDNTVFNANKNSGTYERGVHSLIQRGLYYRGYFKELFGDDLTTELEESKNNWYNSLLTLNYPRYEKEEDVFRSILHTAMETLYKYLSYKDLISLEYFENWQNEFNLEDDEEFENYPKLIFSYGID